MKNQLLLASASKSRQQLLTEALIPYSVISHECDEQSISMEGTIEEVVLRIAQEKRASVTIPASPKSINKLYILVADTMGQSDGGRIYGKPKSYQQAVESIKALCGKGVCSTAFCLEKRVCVDGAWHVEDCIEQVVSARYEFDMPNEWIDKYLHAVPHYQSMSGGITIEGFGAQFLKKIDGSYTTILGLPIFEVRKALQQLNYY